MVNLLFFLLKLQFYSLASVTPSPASIPRSCWFNVDSSSTREVHTCVRAAGHRCGKELPRGCETTASSLGYQTLFKTFF